MSRLLGGEVPRHELPTTKQAMGVVVVGKAASSRKPLTAKAVDRVFSDAGLDTQDVSACLR